MRLRADVGVTAKPQLILTHRMRQALAVLQAPAPELASLIREALLSNPFLELESEVECDLPGTEGGGPMAGEEDPGDGDGRSEDGAAVATVRRECDDASRWERLAGLGGWREALLSQWRLRSEDPEETRIAEYLLGCLDERGYLGLPVSEAAAGLGVARARVEAVRLGLLECEPAGIAATSLVECLLAQLREAGEGESLAARLVAGDLERVARRRLSELAGRHRVAPEAVREAVRRIRQLWPHPAARLPGERVAPVVPDLVVEAAGEGFEVFLNDRAVPQVRIVPPGSALMERADAATRAFVGERMAQARWLVGSLTARQRTLVRLMRRIVAEQGAFFRRGVDGLQPLGYRELGVALGLHESTIARAVRGKHVQTPCGVLPLRFFFSSGLPCVGGERRAAAAVAARIRALIAQETGDPLSDEVLTQRLQAEGLRIARRTVAKYRDRLGIPRACCRRPI
jgi:RNA polymerase sigma-54 factor